MGYSIHDEPHFSQRNNWLRAGVLGANDGLISTASLLMGMASASAGSSTLLLTGLAGLVAGAISMAAGEYVSVSSQSDTEKADLRKEARELRDNPDNELLELALIYEKRGLNSVLARQVAEALTAHARDEIGITEISTANPLQAAGASALAFCAGAILPVLVVLISPAAWLLFWLAVSTLLGLGMLGYLSATLGGAPARPAVIRIVLWGVVALGVVLGLAMGYGQVMRGAHFFSHNLWAGWWVWFSQVAVYGLVSTRFAKE